MTADILDRAAAAALALAADKPWPQVALRDIAVKADVSFAALYALADSKAAVLNHLSTRFDQAALGVDYPAVRRGPVEISPVFVYTARLLRWTPVRWRTCLRTTGRGVTNAVTEEEPFLAVGRQG